MFDSVYSIETAILYLICGTILTISSFTVLFIFLCYKELRKGIYGMVIGTTLSEIYIGIHSVINAIVGLTSSDKTVTNACKIEAFLCVFFFTCWCLQNICIMILFVNRQLKRNSLAYFLHFLSIGLSFLLSALFYSNDLLGRSFNDSCFIIKSSNYAVIILASIFIFLFVLSIAYNIWYFICRDTSKDRSFINGYNYFILATSIFWLFMVTHVILISFFDIYSHKLSIMTIVMNNMCYLFISISRLRIEYIPLVLNGGPSNSKIINFLNYITCRNRLPKFKDIKKVLNVKFISSNINDTTDTIYSVMRTTEQ